MKQLQSVPRKRVLTSALLLALAGPAWAQQAEPQGDTSAAPATTNQVDPTELDTVVVKGIRASLESSMNLKRDAQGVVDGIVAEDIGKFPDTNLAESLQRITGISIERRDGEGAQVTARGFGPQFNMVTLNGRQMPGADAFGASGQVAIGGVDGGTRAFNFAQLAAEGKCVLMISSEMPELLGMCDRICVLNEGAFVAEFPAAEATQEKIMRSIVTSGVN